jgi:hypothetical protein
MPAARSLAVLLTPVFIILFRIKSFIISTRFIDEDVQEGEESRRGNSRFGERLGGLINEKWSAAWGQQQGPQ